MSSHRNGGPLMVLSEVQGFVERHGIGRIEADRIVLLDEGQPIKRCEPPARLLGDEALSQGLAYLVQAKPKLALVLTTHSVRDDFGHLVEVAGHLISTPVVGVEASASQPFSNDDVPPPVMASHNPWLCAFQGVQFPWFKSRGTVMLPAEPQCGPALEEHIEFLAGAFEECLAGTGGHSSEANAHLKRILSSLLGIYRAWGLVAQFGRWLQHPQVAALCEGADIRYPFILGAAHTYELAILDEYCRLDVFALDLGRRIDAAKLNAYGGSYDPELEAKWLQLYMQEVAAGFVLIRDLEVHYPD